MNKSDISAILAKPIARQLLASNIPARLAYTALDGTPRAIPISYLVESDLFRVFSPTNAKKVPALQANPHIGLTIDTVGQLPPHILLVRGTANVEIVDGVPDGFLQASLRNIGEEAFVGFEEMVRGLYKQMAIVTITPTWIKLIDFQETLPQAVQELAQQGS